MRNVWFIPSILTLESWLKKSGFKNIRLVNVTPTTTEEQRKTDWMKFDSLNNFLSTSDSSKTIEGHPAPKRAIVIANAP
jgi:tRNA (mo5U34)-methyltransferase